MSSEKLQTTGGRTSGPSGWGFGLLVFVLIFSFGACSATGLPTIVLDVAGHELTVEVADSPDERATGLMNRKSLPLDRGMLFVFETESQVSFWMKNTLIPLSIAFIADDGTIRQIEDMEPGSLASTVSRRNVRYALEVNQGWFEDHGVVPGDVVGIPENLPRNR